LLIDEGRLTEDADELKQALEEPAFAELHPDDAASLGLADGVPVVLRTAAGEATLPLRVTTHIAPGTVFVPWNQPGCAANTLLMGALTADVAIEAAQPVAVAEEAS
jgi:assimilatory nitrate reductase catalytic subunit